MVDSLKILITKNKSIMHEEYETSNFRDHTVNSCTLKIISIMYHFLTFVSNSHITPSGERGRLGWWVICKSSILGTFLIQFINNITNSGDIVRTLQLPHDLSISSRVPHCIS